MNVTTFFAKHSCISCILSISSSHGITAAHCFEDPTDLEGTRAYVGLLYGCKPNFTANDFYDSQEIEKVDHHPDAAISGTDAGKILNVS